MTCQHCFVHTICVLCGLEDPRGYPLTNVGHPAYVSFRGGKRNADSKFKSRVEYARRALYAIAPRIDYRSAEQVMGRYQLYLRETDRLRTRIGVRFLLRYLMAQIQVPVEEASMTKRVLRRYRDVLDQVERKLWLFD